MQNCKDATELAEILNLDVFGQKVEALTEVINSEDEKPRVFELEDGSSSSKEFMSEDPVVKAIPPTNVCYSVYFYISICIIYYSGTSDVRVEIFARYEELVPEVLCPCTLCPDW